MKSSFLKVIIGLVFLVLFNGLFFYLGGKEQSELNWICYGFIHASYLCILLTPLFCKSGKGLEVLSYSLYLRAFFYFLTELVVGVACIAIAPESPMWPLILQSVLLAIFLVLQIMSVLANDATIQCVEKQMNESVYIQTMAQRIKNSIRNLSDQNVKKQVERCYDAVNNSSLESFPEAVDAELTLRNAVELLCTAIDNEDYQDIDKKAKAVISAVQDRNAIIKRCRFN
ncbi:MAG: hypothetical protein IJE85_08740 [Bacteroidales bacterium]|nr:hypothetical protein [Bacteroidales bacterium]